MRASWLVLTLSFFGCAAARVECPVHGGRQWLDVSTPHFHIRTNLSPGAAREQAQTLEQLLQAIRWVVDYTVDPRGIEVIAVEEDDLESFGWKFNGRELGGKRMILESWSATSLRGRTASTTPSSSSRTLKGTDSNPSASTTASGAQPSVRAWDHGIGCRARNFSSAALSVRTATL